MKSHEKETVEEALRPVDATVADLLVENHRRFQAFLSKRVGSVEVAEDLLQQSLKRALEHPPTTKEEPTIIAWFFQILKNTLTDYYRANAAGEKKLAEFQNESIATGPNQVAAMDEIEAEVCACMRELLPTLKEGYSVLIDRIDLKGESKALVARDLGLTENNLTVRLHRARQALKVSLQRTCGTCTEHGCLNCTCE